MSTQTNQCSSLFARRINKSEFIHSIRYIRVPLKVNFFTADSLIDTLSYCRIDTLINEMSPTVDMTQSGKRAVGITENVNPNESVSNSLYEANPKNICVHPFHLCHPRSITFMPLNSVMVKNKSEAS